MPIRHDYTASPRDSLWHTPHTTGTESEGDMLYYTGGEWVSAPQQYAHVVMQVGITDPPEPVSNVDGDGYVYFLVDAY